MSSEGHEVIKSVKFFQKPKKVDNLRRNCKSKSVKKNIISDNEDSLDQSYRPEEIKQCRQESYERSKRKAKTDAIETLRLIKVFSKKSIRDISIPVENIQRLEHK